ncbi:MAG TPA: outer membrane protein assembly factor BamC [Marinagarivorans sp.]
MNKVIAQNALLLCAAMGVSGCGMFADRSNEYKEAAVMAEMKLPEGVESAPLESAFRVPEVTVNEFDYIDEDEKLVVPRPAPMSQDSEYARVKIQKVGERRWVLAEAPTSQVWPLVQSFLARNGIIVAKARPASGEIETGWLNFKVDANTKSRYRIHIEKGVREESSEIHVLHQQAGMDVEVNEWSKTSSDAEREAWMLDELAVSVAQGISNRAASLLGQSVGGDDKITLRRAGEEPVLDIRLDRERTHATLAHALTREGLHLWKDDTEIGVFYFAYDDPSDEPSWFDKITFRGNDDVPEEPPVALSDLLANLGESARAIFGDLAVAGFTDQSAKPTLGYLLRIRENEGKMTVYIRNTRGEMMPFREAKQLMIIIRRNLI